MKIQRSRTAISYFLIIIVLITVSNFGCGRSPREAARFATAGTTYAAAMDLLLVRAGDLSIDANSEFLLFSDVTANQTAADYKDLTDADREKLIVINRLRAHTKLLGHYFELLYELSTSDAPQQTAKAIEGTVSNINDFGNKLRGSDIITDSAKGAISSVTRLIVTAEIRKAINEELRVRNRTIRKELVTQEELLKILADDIEHNNKIANKIREQRLVIDPLTNTVPIPAGNIDKWKSDRRVAITAYTTIEDLKTASQAVKKLRKAYESLLSGKLDLVRINDALSDFEIIISTAESLKKLGDSK
jgi:hypothetical protein